MAKYTICITERSLYDRMTWLKVIGKTHGNIDVDVGTENITKNNVHGLITMALTLKQYTICMIIDDENGLTHNVVIRKSDDGKIIVKGGDGGIEVVIE